jgi:hypothetical protein
MASEDLSAERRIVDPAGWVVDYIRTLGLENLARRYYGIYPGIVVDNADPDKNGRCRIAIAAIGHGAESEVPPDYWAMPNFPGLAKGRDTAQMRGVWMPPEVGDTVWVQFQNGDVSFPVYGGGFLPAESTNDLADAACLKKGIRTATGHLIQINDDPANLSITIAKGDGVGAQSGAMISLDKDGGLVVLVDSGSSVTMDAKKGGITFMNVDPETEAVTSWATLGKDTVQMGNVSGCLFSMSGGNVTIDAKGNLTLVAAGKIWANSGKVCLGKGPLFEPAIRGMRFSTWATSHTHIHEHTAPPGGGPTVVIPASVVVPPPAMMNELSEVVSIG